MPPLSFNFLPSDTSPLRIVKRPTFPVPVVPPTDAARDAISNSFFRLMCFVISLKISILEGKQRQAKGGELEKWKFSLTQGQQFE